MPDRSSLEWERCESLPLPETVPPPGGWRQITCSFESHRWVLHVEGGRASISCADSCDPTWFDPAGRTPACLCDWQPEDFFGEDIPVALEYVDDSTPSTPAGPAEYGYYIVVRAAATGKESSS